MDRRFWMFAGLVVGVALCLGLGVTLAQAALDGDSAGASLWQSLPWVTPEPTTVAFMGVGLAGLLLLRRRSA